MASCDTAQRGQAATKVAQTGSLLCRGLAIRRAPPTASRRNSRLTICATKNRRGVRRFREILIDWQSALQILTLAATSLTVCLPRCLPQPKPAQMRSAGAVENAAPVTHRAGALRSDGRAECTARGPRRPLAIFRACATLISEVTEISETNNQPERYLP